MAKRRGDGEGSIYRRKSDGKWVGSVTLGWELGKRRRKVVYGDSQAEVIAKLEKLKREESEGRLPRTDEKVTVGQFMREWVDEHLPGTVADSTVESYRYIVEHHIVPPLGGYRIDKLRPRDVQALLSLKRKEGLSPRTRRYIHAVLRRGLGVAERWGFVGRNVASLVETPKIPRSEPRVFSNDEIRRILIAAEAERLYALIGLALMTGLRLGELLALTWGDVDLEARVVHVRRTRRRTGTVAEPKTAAGIRRVTLPPRALDLLEEHRDLQHKEREKAGDAWVDENLVFTTEEGRPLGHRFVQRVWYRTLRRARVESCGFHHLRKIYTSLLASQGVHPKTAQELLGHADIRTTMEAYTAVNDAMRRQAADKLDDALDEVASEDKDGEPPDG